MEEYTVKITRQAQVQMEEIADYIAFVLQEPQTARRLLDSLDAEIASLSRFPGRVALTEDEPWHSLGIHKLSVKNYLVYFWIDKEQRIVQVTAVIHGSRDQKIQLKNLELN